MEKLTITAAAALAKTSRQTLYNMMNAGKIAVNREDPKNPWIDKQEIVRAFDLDRRGKRQVDKGKTAANLSTSQAEINILREELARAQEREQWLRGKVDELAGQLASLSAAIEHKPAPRRGFFSWLKGG
jgi:hypothetical protein